MIALSRPSQISLPLLLSLIVHAGAIVWLLDGWLSPQPPPVRAPLLSVELSTAQTPRTNQSTDESVDARATQSASPPAHRSARSVKQAATPILPRRVALSPSRPEAQHATNEFEPPFLGGQSEQPVLSSPASAAQRSTALRNDVVNYLNQQFQHRFVYPYHARRQGWQGRVLVHIEINQNGSLERIEVAESSGYDLLDRNAVETFRKIGQLKPALQTRLSETSQYAIPVIYRLTRG